MNSKWIAAGLALGFIGLAAGPAPAAEDASDPETQSAAQAAAPAPEQAAAPESAKPAEPEPEYAFGTVKSVGGDRITLNEFDYDTGKENETAYGLDSNTAYENVASAKEISAGDEVDIDYLLKDGKKVAVTVSVSKPVAGEETE